MISSHCECKECEELRKENKTFFAIIEMYKKAIMTAQAYNTRTLNKIQSMMSSLGK